MYLGRERQMERETVPSLTRRTAELPAHAAEPHHAHASAAAALVREIQVSAACTLRSPQTGRRCQRGIPPRLHAGEHTVSHGKIAAFSNLVLSDGVTCPFRPPAGRTDPNATLCPSKSTSDHDRCTEFAGKD
ncbi:hypothetical protein L1887_54986 [Cichorium endivia]|nr:hypothetical protein L1887_54986 [Cichorium endivia]